MGSKYGDLEKFRDIFKRPNFYYISDRKAINSIYETIKELPGQTNSEAKVREMELFLENLSSFHADVYGNSNFRETDHGFAVVEKTLRTAIAVLKKTPELKESIGRGYFSKFSRAFAYGMREFARGVKASLDFRNISSINLSNSEMIEFTMDKKIGLGRKFLFNKEGSFSFTKNIRNLERRDLAKVPYLLENGSRTIKGKGWRVIGSSKCRLRIICGKEPLIGKTKVFYLYVTKGNHDEYENKLIGVEMKTAPFSPA